MLHNDEIFEEILHRTETHADDVLSALQAQYGIEDGNVFPADAIAIENAVKALSDVLFRVFANQYKYNR